MPEPVSLFGVYWLRPWWLLALVALAVCWWRLRARRRGDQWRDTVDEALRPHVLDRSTAGPGLSDRLLFAGWVLAVLVLAGPVWERQRLPATDLTTAEVLVVDLSASMRATDVPPTRYEQARFLIEDLLASAGDAMVGMIVFSERPYVLSPLTDDLDTLRHFVSSLSPDIMPVQGSRIDLAIDQARTLLDRTGIDGGHVLLLTDGVVSARDIEAATRVERAGHRLSVAVIAAEPDTSRTRTSVAVGEADREGLRALSRVGGGAFVNVSPTVPIADRLASVRRDLGRRERAGAPGGAERWVDRGAWAVLVLGLGAVGLFVRYRVA